MNCLTIMCKYDWFFLNPTLAHCSKGDKNKLICTLNISLFPDLKWNSLTLMNFFPDHFLTFGNHVGGQSFIPCPFNVGHLKHLINLCSHHVNFTGWNKFCSTNLKIRKSWSISESPWKRGFFVTISANMHPTLQMSTGQAYLWHPKRTSGALYHRVTT